MNRKPMTGEPLYERMNTPMEQHHMPEERQDPPMSPPDFAGREKPRGENERLSGRETDADGVKKTAAPFETETAAAPRAVVIAEMDTEQENNPSTFGFIVFVLIALYAVVTLLTGSHPDERETEETNAETAVFP